MPAERIPFGGRGCPIRSEDQTVCGWETQLLQEQAQLEFKGVPQLLVIRIELIKIVGDLEHCVSF